jgi:hypothetical protein
MWHQGIPDGFVSTFIHNYYGMRFEPDGLFDQQVMVGMGSKYAYLEAIWVLPNHVKGLRADGSGGSKDSDAFSPFYGPDGALAGWL